MSDSNRGPAITRRGLIKTAGVTAGAAATYGGATQLDALDPVGEVDAIGFLAYNLAVGYVAGNVLGSPENDEPEIDTEDVLEDQLYNVGTSVADGRETFEDEIQSQFIDRSNDRTPYANAAWQAVRAAAAKVVVNGGSSGEAETAAAEALDKQTSRAIVNMVERWNTGVESMIEGFVTQVEEGLSVYDVTNKDLVQANESAGRNGDWSGVGYSAPTGGGYTVFEAPVPNLPVMPSNLEGRSESLSIYAVASSGGSDMVVAPRMDTFGGSDYDPIGNEVIQVGHSSLSTQPVLDAGLYSDAISSIESSYSTISSDLSTYVTSLTNALTEGAIDPSDILSSEDIVNEFGQSSDQARLAAEIMAVGGNVPGEVGYQAKISHPELASDELWAWIYPQFASGVSDVSVSAGTTISSSDYDIAYIGYNSQANDKFITRVLSGDSDLEILDVAGVENEDQAGVSESADGSAGTDGAVTVWSGSDPPEPLTDPTSYQGWKIVVTGANSTSRHPVSDISKDGDSYKLQSTSLTDGETVESVEIVPGTNYTQPVDHVSDATDIGDVEAQLQAQRETIDQLKEELDSGGSGGFGLPSFGLGVPDWIVYGGAGLVALFAWSRANEDDGY